MRLTIAEARAAALLWLRKRDLPRARFVAQRGYDAEKQGRRHVVMLPVEKLGKYVPIIDLIVHDDGYVTVVNDNSRQVLKELRAQGIDAYQTPGLLGHTDAFKYFITAIQSYAPIPEWFVSFDVCERLRLHEMCDAYANVRRNEERIIPVPVKILPTKAEKHAHMRPLSSHIASQMIAMVVNRHLVERTVAEEFFKRLTNMRESYLTAQG